LALVAAVPGFLSVWLVKRRAMRWRQERRVREAVKAKEVADKKVVPHVLLESEKV